MKKFLVFAVLCGVIFGSSLFSISQEIPLGGIMIYSKDNIYLEISFVGMEKDFCIVDVVFLYNGVKQFKKRKRVCTYRSEEYVDLTPNHKLTLFYAGTKGGEVYALLNDKQI